MSSDCQEASVWPPHTYARYTLIRSGELNYDSIIKWERIEKLLGYKRHGLTEWRFREEFIKFSAAVKEAGYLFTERGMNNTGVRVLSRKEMADAVKNASLSHARRSLRHSRMLSEVPRANLPPEEVAKLDHWEGKSAIIGHASKYLIRRKTLPSPEMAIKSIKQL